MKVWNARTAPRGWENHPNVVYVGRPRKGQLWGFGNPFVVGRDGGPGECIPKFEKWLATGDPQGNPDATEDRRQWILNNLRLLKGKHLVCWCAPKPCHAEVLMRLANRQEKNMITICLWPDNDWCLKEDIESFTNKSDDYIEVDVTDEEFEAESFDYDQMIRDKRNR